MDWLVLACRGAVRIAAVALLASVGAWLLVEAAPGSPAPRAARAAGVLPADDGAVPAEVRAALLARVAREHHLEGGAPARLVRQLAGLARFDPGRSWHDGAEIRDRLRAPVRRTLALILAAFLLAVVVGGTAAVAAARRPGGPADLALSVIAAFGLSAPPAWIGMLGLRALSTGEPWRLLPAGGLDVAAAAILPLFTLALVPACVIARHARASIVDGVSAPWAIAARARGLPPGRVAAQALRAGAAGLTGLATGLVAYLLGASLVVERLFGIRGLGATVADAAARGDAPVLVAASGLGALVLATTSVLAEASARALDPRLRDAARTGDA